MYNAIVLLCTSYCSMNGGENGVQAFIRKYFQLVIYVHCIIYYFNLAVSLACEVICIRNALETINSCYNFFSWIKWKILPRNRNLKK